MRLDECLRIINRRIRNIEQEVARRHRLGLQSRPWLHRVQELEEVRREIAALATPKELRTGTEMAAAEVRTPDRSSRRGRRSLPAPDRPRPSS